MNRTLKKYTLTALLALPMAANVACGGAGVAPLQGVTVPNSQAAAPNLQAMAQAFRMEVPRTEVNNWGWHEKIVELCPGDYLVIGENEEWPNCPTGPNPSRTLYSEFKASPSAVDWLRDDTKTALVSSATDKDFMKIYAPVNKDIALNNLLVDDNGIVAEPVRKHQTLTAAQALTLGLDIGQVSGSCPTATQLQELHQLARWLHGESDPWAITTVGLKAQGANGHGIYAINVYRVEADKTANLILAATLDYGTGVLQRDDAKSNLSGSYAKIFASLNQPNGFWFRKYGIDNKAETSSTLFIPELESQP